MESIHGEVGEVEQSGNTSQSCTNAGNSSSKRHKELENVALQTSLNSLRMEAQNISDPEIKGSQETEEDTRPGRCTESGAPAQTPNLRPGEECETSEIKVREEERTLTDHLNKRLLSSFLEKLNQRDLALPGIQRLDCAVAGEEDSNRAVEEW
uniref:Uncharacterized protein n=1 Tax=Anguilla anguilla TaxID=7936 RepID=A0A0E9XEX8_ANGAN